MKRGIIDRFEGDLVVIEINEETIDVPRDNIPSDAREGDVLTINGNVYTIDKNETNKRKREIQELMDKLFES
ncbi:DUF3006 domain-containing protein [Bacillus wiedmannii]|uniref:Pyruvate kinase n=1 Tax=Bacillus wiedmannii TaxID=1890302 RepID=A0A242ZNB0_9BACI|nr:DUF3006 domain-containing protein [Bacillus wiedmannii]MED3126630.1 DUF3006 domain-containing protein [Bacillus wiedmannii]OTX97189.1 pyruvate kinase [Bacillus wiedmannii]